MFEHDITPLHAIIGTSKREARVGARPHPLENSPQFFLLYVGHFDFFFVRRGGGVFFSMWGFFLKKNIVVGVFFVLIGGFFGARSSLQKFLRF